MATSPMSEVMRQLRQAVPPLDGSAAADGILLERFVVGRDGAAFAALLRRHGPMGWGVCRRVLPGHQDAEDAFQATFLVLVRKAASVVPREMVGNWLYGVAHQTARNARAGAARRRARERQVIDMPEPAAPERDLWHDLRPILDQELSRLPDKYRAAIVLCDLEGRTRKDVAGQLGVPEGTLSGHLTRGRAILAKRLARHGLATSGGALAGVLSENALSAGVSASVVVGTIRAAGLLPAGPAATAGIISPHASALAEGVIQVMFLTKLKIATTVSLLVLAAGIGTTGLIYDARAGRTFQEASPLAQERPRKPTPATPATRPAETKAGFTLGRETTYITAPLRKDGSVDYETALNERMAKDISPEKNANALLWQALRPQLKHAPIPPGFFDWLKIPEPPERGEYFRDLAGYAREDLKLEPGGSVGELYAERDRLARRPWLAKDHPRMAAWLRANEKPLAMVVEAAGRPDYFNPLVSRKTGDEGWYGLHGAPLPAAVKCYGEVVPALAARAMWHAGEEQPGEAWRDPLACHHLGRLIARGADWDEFLLGAAIVQTAAGAELTLLDRVGTAKQIPIWRRDLDRLARMPAVADTVDLGLRFKLLDTVMIARRTPVRTLRLIEFLEGRGKQKPGTDPEPERAVLDSLDGDGMLHYSNVWCDRVVAALRLPDYGAREKEFGRIEAELDTMRQAATSPAEVIAALRGGRLSGPELSPKLNDRARFSCKGVEG